MRQACRGVTAADETDRRHARRRRGGDAGDGILDHDAIFRCNLAARRREQEKVGRGFALRTSASRKQARLEKPYQPRDFEARADAVGRRRRGHGLWPADPGQRMGGMGERSQLRAQPP